MSANIHPAHDQALILDVCPACGGVWENEEAAEGCNTSGPNGDCDNFWESRPFQKGVLIQVGGKIQLQGHPGQRWLIQGIAPSTEANAWVFTLHNKGCRIQRTLTFDPKQYRVQPSTKGA